VEIRLGSKRHMLAYQPLVEPVAVDELPKNTCAALIVIKLGCHLEIQLVADNARRPALLLFHTAVVGS
jgi:hypothetical protein